MKARREAMAADLVVVNHHLFFADMALRDSGVAELLPSVEVAVFDEAHQLAEAGVQFLGTTLGSGAGDRLRARHARPSACSRRAACAPWQELAAGVRSRGARPAPGLRRARCATCAAALKLRWDERAARDELRRTRWRALGAGLRRGARGARDGERARRPTSSSSPSARTQLRAARRRASREPAAAGQVRWIDLLAAAGAAGRVAARHPRRAARADGARRRRPGSSRRPRSATTSA